MNQEQLNARIKALQIELSRAKSAANRLRHVSMVDAYQDAQERVTDISYDLDTLTKYKELLARYTRLKHQEYQALTNDRSVSDLRTQILNVCAKLKPIQEEVESMENQAA